MWNGSSENWGGESRRLGNCRVECGDVGAACSDRCAGKGREGPEDMRMEVG
jgi:hypothetical protein